MESDSISSYKTLNILHVTPFFPPSIGGISSLVYNLCNALTKLGNNIYVIASKNIRKQERTLSSTPLKLKEINSIYLLGWPYSTLRNFSIPFDFGRKINFIIKNGNFDVVHVHGHHYPICWMALHYANKYDIPTILSLHGTYALNPKNLGGKSALEDLFNRYIFSKILRKSNIVIGGTSQIINYAKKYSTIRNELKIVPNGVNTAQYFSNLKNKNEYRKKLNIDTNKVVILFIGRFDESKGALEFAKAAKFILTRYKDKFVVMMVGNGNQESQISSILKGVSNIHIKNWQPPEKLHEFFIASDIFVLPSKFEGLPLTIIEAMSANLHIVYSDVGGVKDILNGYDKKSILSNTTPLEIVNTLLKLNPNSQMSRHDPITFNYIQNFDWIKIATEVTAIYKKLLQ